jgi:hypothetical protein
VRCGFARLGLLPPSFAAAKAQAGAVLGRVLADGAGRREGDNSAHAARGIEGLPELAAFGAVLSEANLVTHGRPRRLREAWWPPPGAER